MKRIPPPPPVPFSRRSRAFHGEPAAKRARWSEIQRQWAEAQRDFREIWTEKAEQTGAPSSASD
jgi:hypothetical protein